jgi:hypothetical protein
MGNSGLSIGIEIVEVREKAARVAGVGTIEIANLLCLQP